jgi:hypothetical protein
MDLMDRRTDVRHWRRSRRACALVAALAAALALAGCFDVQEPDLFLLTRTGPSGKLTLLVNTSGTISCNGGKAKMISSSTLITARDLSDNLGTDASHNLTIRSEPGTVNYFRVRMQQGTISFPDKAADARHPNLAQIELFATQEAVHACGLSG